MCRVQKQSTKQIVLSETASSVSVCHIRKLQISQGLQSVDLLFVQPVSTLAAHARQSEINEIIFTLLKL